MRGEGTKITPCVLFGAGEHLCMHGKGTKITPYVLFGAGKPLPLGFYITLDPEFWDTTTADTL
mgnify:FL=1